MTPATPPATEAGEAEPVQSADDRLQNASENSEAEESGSDGEDQKASLSWPSCTTFTACLKLLELW